MTCSLCGRRKARRACPALGARICAVCCGTKRLVQIRCPSDCSYLAAAREHPSAAAVRRQQADVGLLVRSMRDLNRRQSQLFLLVSRFLVGYEPAGFQQVVDDDVAEATTALAATIETSVRGVIYEHRPASLPAERLMGALKPIIAEASRNGGTPAERDAAIVLQRVAEAAREIRASEEGHRRAFLDLLARAIKTTDASPGGPGGTESEPPRLIVP